MRDSNLDYSTNTAADYDSLNIIKVSQGYFFDGFQMRAMAAQGKRRLAGMRHMGMVAFNPDSTTWNRTGSAPEPDTALGAPAWASAAPDTTLDTLFYITFSADSTPVPDSTRVIVARDLFLTTSPETNWTTNDSVLVSFTNEDVGWFYYKARSRYTTRYDTHESDDTVLKSLYRHPDAFGAPGWLSPGPDTTSTSPMTVVVVTDSTPTPDSTAVIVSVDRSLTIDPDTVWTTNDTVTVAVDDPSWLYHQAWSAYGPNTSAKSTLDSTRYEPDKGAAYVAFAASYSGTTGGNIILSVTDTLDLSAETRNLSDTLWYTARIRGADPDTMLEDSTGVDWLASAEFHVDTPETTVVPLPSYNADSSFYIAYQETNTLETGHIIEARINWGPWVNIDTTGNTPVAGWDTVKIDTTNYSGPWRGVWDVRVCAYVDTGVSGIEKTAWTYIDSLLHNQAVPIYTTGENKSASGVVNRYGSGDTVLVYSILPYSPIGVAYADTCISSVVPFAKLSVTLPTAGHYKVRGSDDGKSTWAVIDTSQWSQGGAAQTTYDQVLIAIYGNDSTCVDMSEDSVIFQSRYKRFSDDYETAWANEDTVVWADKVGPVFAAAPSFVAWDTTSDAGNVSMQVTATADENASGHWEWKLNAADSWTAFTGSDSAKADATPDTTVETGTAVASVDSVFIRVRGYDEDNNLGEYSASLDSSFTRAEPGALYDTLTVIVASTYSATHHSSADTHIMEPWIQGAFVASGADSTTNYSSDTSPALPFGAFPFAPGEVTGGLMWAVENFADSLQAIGLTDSARIIQATICHYNGYSPYADGDLTDSGDSYNIVYCNAAQFDDWTGTTTTYQYYDAAGTSVWTPHLGQYSSASDFGILCYSDTYEFTWGASRDTFDITLGIQAALHDDDNDMKLLLYGHNVSGETNCGTHYRGPGQGGGDNDPYIWIQYEKEP